MKVLKEFDPPWYGFARIFETDEAAKADWQILNDVSADEAARRQLAGYRVLWEGRPNVVVIVGHLRKQVEDAESMIHGVDLDVPDGFYRPLVLRRARFMKAAMEMNAPEGVYTTLTDGKMTLDPDGQIVPNRDDRNV